MGFIKNAIIGVAIYQAVKFLTRKDDFGRTKIDEIKEKAPEWMEKARALKDGLPTRQTLDGY